MKLMESLGVLIRRFMPGVGLSVGSFVITMRFGGRYVRVAHIIESNCLDVYSLDVNGNREGPVSSFDLCDQRAFGAMIRSVCQRIGVSVPSFAEIDEVLGNRFE